MALPWFFKFPFANSGDKLPIPNTTQGDGSISYPEGYGVDYELDPGEPNVLYPDRDTFNQLMYAITANLQQWQTQAYPEFITTADNGGSPYSYNKWAFVRYTTGGVASIYYSLVDANTALPTDTTKWAIYSPNPTTFLTGMMQLFEGTTLPSGWVWANGLTIGDGSSNATGRANADTAALFTLIWTSFPNGVRPILDSSGTPSSRGVSAAADFTAHKALPLRDMRGCVPAGLTTMGGTSDRGNLTDNVVGGVNGTVFGATGGDDINILDIGQIPAHTHTVYGQKTDQDASGIGSLVRPNSDNQNYQTSSAGGGLAHNNTQPTTICNYIIKL